MMSPDLLIVFKAEIRRLPFRKTDETADPVVPVHFDLEYDWSKTSPA
jgi:hypothetical protein